jgi:hypothetical protein
MPGGVALPGPAVSVACGAFGGGMTGGVERLFCGKKVCADFEPSWVRPILELSSHTPVEDGAHGSAVVFSTPLVLQPP